MKLFSKKEQTFQDAMDLYNKKKYKQAAEICENLLKVHKENFEILNLLGDTYHKLGDKKKALETFNKLLKKFEGESFVDRALALTKKIIRLYPEEVEYREKLAEIYGRKKLVREMMDLLEDIATNYESEGKPTEASRVLRRMLEIDMKNPADVAELLRRIERAGSKEDITTAIEKALALKKLTGDYPVVFVDKALEYGVDRTFYIDRIDDYILCAPDRFSHVADISAEKLEEKFDKEFYELICEKVDSEQLVPFLVRLKQKYKSADIYGRLLDIARENQDMDMVANLTAEVAALPEDDIEYDLAKAVVERTSDIENHEILEKVYEIVVKAHAYDIKDQVMDILREAYEKAGETEKAQKIADEIYGAASSGPEPLDTAPAAGVISDFDDDEGMDDPETREMLESTLSSYSGGSEQPEGLTLDNFGDDSSDENVEVGTVELDSFGSDDDGDANVAEEELELDSFGAGDDEPEVEEEVLDLDSFQEEEKKPEPKPEPPKDKVLEIPEDEEFDLGMLSADDEPEEDDIFGSSDKGEESSSIDDMFGDLEPSEPEPEEEKEEENSPSTIDDLDFDNYTGDEEEVKPEKNTGSADLLSDLDFGEDSDKK